MTFHNSQTQKVQLSLNRYPRNFFPLSSRHPLAEISRQLNTIQAVLRKLTRTKFLSSDWNFCSSTKIFLWKQKVFNWWILIKIIVFCVSLWKPDIYQPVLTLYRTPYFYATYLAIRFKTGQLVTLPDITDTYRFIYWVI
jgi:hypothetical protein